MRCISKGHWRHRQVDIRRGSYVGTSDDRADGWYLDHVDAEFLDRRGAGLPTLADCRDQIDSLRAPHPLKARLASLVQQYRSKEPDDSHVLTPLPPWSE